MTMLASSLILLLLFTVSSNAVDKIRSPKSMDDVLPKQQGHLNITSNFAIISMDNIGAKSYAASFILPAAKPLKFAFNVNWQDGITVEGNMQLQLNSGNDSTTISFKIIKAIENQITFISSHEKFVGGTTKNITMISFELSPFGELTNDGVSPQTDFYQFPGLFNVEHGERQLDFVLTWEITLLLECHIPIGQFAVDAPPPTTTISTTTIAATPEDPEEYFPSTLPSTLSPTTTTTKPAVKNKFVKRLIFWIFGCFFFLAAVSSILGIASFCLRKHVKAFKPSPESTPLLKSYAVISPSLTNTAIPTSAAPQPPTTSGTCNATTERQSIPNNAQTMSKKNGMKEPDYIEFGQLQAMAKKDASSTKDENYIELGLLQAK